MEITFAGPKRVCNPTVTGRPRLTPDYNTPSDAQLLPPPGGWKPNNINAYSESVQPSRRPVQPGAFKPRNTMDESMPIRPQKQKDRMQGPVERRKLAMHEIEGGNVNPRSRHVSKDTGRTIKHSASTWFKPGLQQESVRDRGAKSITTTPQGRDHASDSRPLFGNDEFENVDKMSHTKSAFTSKKKRKRANEVASSVSGRRSSHSASQTSHDIEAHAHKGGLPDTLEVSQRMMQDAAASTRKGHVHDVEGLRPPINLTKGFEAPQSNTVKRARRQQRDDATIEHELSLLAQLEEARGMTDEQMMRHTSNKRTVGHDAQRSTDFVPVHSADRIYRQKQLATPGRGNSPESDGTDPLAGPTTVRATPRGPTGHSPLQQTSYPRDESQLSPTGPHRSEIHGTRPSSERRATDSSHHIRTHVRQNMNSKFFVKINAIHHSLCNLTNGSICLEWIPKEKHFLVKQNGDRILIPLEGRCVTFGPGWQKWRYHDDSCKVLLSGSATSGTRGILLIDFASDDDKYDFRDGLLIACPNLHFEVKDKDWIENAWNNQVKVLSENLESRRTIVKPQPAQVANEDVIIYEDDNVEDKTKDTPRCKVSHASRPSQVRMEEGDEPVQSEPGTAYSQGLRRSIRGHMANLQPKRESTPPALHKHSATLNPWQHPVLYPTFPSAPRRVTVDFKDLERLDEGEFLNDSIISFALREVEEKMLKVPREDIYMFNTFFYSNLTTSKTGKRGFNYDAVKRWTNKIDLFSYKYVVVPINLNMHWFVAIICNLPLLLDSASSEVNNKGEEVVKPESRDGPEIVNLEDELVSDQDPPVPIGDLSISEDTTPRRDVGIKEQHSANGSGKKGSKSTADVVPKYNHASDFFIMTLDSLGSARTTEIRYLQKYLVAEAEDKRKVVIDIKQFAGTTARGIPQQSNFCDCGIFLVAYIQTFADNPYRFVRDILTWSRDGNTEIMDVDPTAKRTELRDRLVKLNAEQEAIRREARQRKIDARAASVLASSQTTARGDDSVKTSRKQTLHSSQDSTARAEHVRRDQVRNTPVAKVLQEIDEEDDLPVVPPQPAGAGYRLHALPPPVSDRPSSSASADLDLG